ncbi:unnamed protein product [Linum trigynum]|uniref:Transposase n=1 Tax=Linum trigynum TaxID=586398 RepID=A0AAV2E9S5_9ROSI
MGRGVSTTSSTSDDNVWRYDASPTNGMSSPGHTYNQCYYLDNRIYPEWATFVKTITAPNNQKKKLFAKRQEAYRKDVERAFGILQERWVIIIGSSRVWDVHTMGEIMLACIILHNMIVEDQQNNGEEALAMMGQYDTNSDFTVDPPDHDMSTLMSYKASHGRIRDRQGHHSLRDDLVEHLWAKEGGGE